VIYDKPRFTSLPGGILHIDVGDEVSLSCSSRVHDIYSALSDMEGVGDLTPAYGSIAAKIDMELTKAATVKKAVEKAWKTPRARHEVGRLVKVPVCYEGGFAPDLEELARHAGMKREDVVALHASKEYTCMMLGFMPGFVYLDEVDPRIRIERLEAPRTKVPSGSVGIAGAQTGIYGLESPGGWRLIGRTPLTTFNPSASPPAPIGPGDRVKFEPITAQEYGFVKKASPAAPKGAAGTPVLEVRQPGLFATVQDKGRFAFRYLGVPSSGGLDIASMMQSNYIVGNPGGWPAIEVIGGYFQVRALSDVVVAVTGCDCAMTVRGEPAETYEPILLKPGDDLAIGKTSGMLNYMSVAGRLSADTVMGSCSTYPRGGFGGFSGRSLKVGDLVGIESLSERVLMREIPKDERVSVREDPIRAVGSSIQGSKPKLAKSFFGDEYTVSEASDRTGYRLKHAERFTDTSGHVLTYPTYCGYVQVPPDGSPIVLQKDCPTTGGYELVAVVLPSEMGRFSQLKPGSKVGFEEVDDETSAKEEKRFLRLLRKYAVASPGI